jgi:hypothetical protein
VNLENKWFPPLSDPAQWGFFVRNTINGEGALSGRQPGEQWHTSELRGDKLIATITMDLFEKYGFSHSWSNALLRVFLSNEYFKKIAKAQRLLEHLLSPLCGKKGTSDPLEVALPFLLLIFWCILLRFKRILCIYLLAPHRKSTIGPSWRRH